MLGEHGIAEAMRLARIALVGGILGCTAHGQAVFRPTDPTFRASPGVAPRLYDATTIETVPKVSMRSVGLIEVTATTAARTAEAAIEKGRQLGCWILVEHSTFETLKSRARLEGRAILLLAHSGLHVQTTQTPRAASTTFDCVVPEQVPLRSACRLSGCNGAITAASYR